MVTNPAPVLIILLLGWAGGIVTQHHEARDGSAAHAPEKPTGIAACEEILFAQSVDRLLASGADVVVRSLPEGTPTKVATALTDGSSATLNEEFRRLSDLGVPLWVHVAARTGNVLSLSPAAYFERPGT